MPAPMLHEASPSTRTRFDAIVVGAGFAGLFALHRLRTMGMTVRVFEAAGGIGGTWFWNRYPGARCDVESMDYSYSFSEELEQEWNWTERYASQPEILRYLNHVADRFDLCRDIQLETRVMSVLYEEHSGLWTVVTADGAEYAAKFCVMASGVLSRVKTPDIAGIDSFAGERYLTARWPSEGVDFTGKRVAVIGTGSTGVQAIPQIAREAEHLYVFQRTPNYSVPARNHPLAEEFVAQVKARYGERRAEARRSAAGVPGDPAPRSALGVSPEERRQIYEDGWKKGGGPAILRAFADLMTNLEANATAAEFVRSKIRQTVRDADVAEALAPNDHPLGAKRLCVDTDYYETYNRDNVTLVDLRNTPIETILPAGIRTADSEYEVDILVLAIGFDAITGALLDIDIRGRHGQALRETWADGPQTYLGLMVAGFPNLFTVAGPGSPSVLGNVVHHIEQHIDWIVACLSWMQERGFAAIEPAPEAVGAWTAHVNELAAATLYPAAKSWFVGANVPGKPRMFMPYAGGAKRYREECNEIAGGGYRGFLLREETAAIPRRSDGKRVGLAHGGR